MFYRPLSSSSNPTAASRRARRVASKVLQGFPAVKHFGRLDVTVDCSGASAGTPPILASHLFFVSISLSAACLSRLIFLPAAHHPCSMIVYHRRAYSALCTHHFTLLILHPSSFATTSPIYVRKTLAKGEPRPRGFGQRSSRGARPAAFCARNMGISCHGKEFPLRSVLSGCFRTTERPSHRLPRAKFLT